MYDSAWENVTGARMTTGPLSKVARRDLAHEKAAMKKSLTLSGFGSQYDGTYKQHLISIDGRPVYAKGTTAFVYYSTQYSNWLVTNSLKNCIKGAGLHRTAGKTFELTIPVESTWETYNYSQKKWLTSSTAKVVSNF